MGYDGRDSDGDLNNIANIVTSEKWGHFIFKASIQPANSNYSFIFTSPIVGTSLQTWSWAERADYATQIYTNYHFNSNKI